MRKKGIIKTWNNEQGFGFIQLPDGHKGLFVHINDIYGLYERPEIGLMVSYKLSKDHQGRPCAIKVRPINQQDKNLLEIIKSYISYMFLIILSIMFSLNYLPTVLLLWYLVFFSLTYLLYLKDKSAAKNNRWRTPENTLHLFALLGGWPAAMLAQQKLRHKSRKRSFQIKFWLTVMLNSGCFIWLLMPPGQELLNKLIN